MATPKGRGGLSARVRQEARVEPATPARKAAAETLAGFMDEPWLPSRAHDSSRGVAK